MKLRLETCRPLVYKVGWLKDQGQGRDARVGDGQAPRLGVLRPEQPRRRPALRGDAGTRPSSGVERDLRDSVGSLIFSGTNDIQRNIIARQLRL